MGGAAVSIFKSVRLWKSLCSWGFTLKCPQLTHGAENDWTVLTAPGKATTKLRSKWSCFRMVVGSLSSVSTWSPLQVVTDTRSSDILIPLNPTDPQPGTVAPTTPQQQPQSLFRILLLQGSWKHIKNISWYTWYFITAFSLHCCGYISYLHYKYFTLHTFLHTFYYINIYK